jgi:hypothetical protein
MLRIRVEWNDPTAELALYLPDDPYAPVSAYRYCCGSPMVANYSMNFDFDVAFVTFESRNGNRPSPDESVSFTLHVEQLE